MLSNVDPVVIDDELLRKAVNDQITPEVAEIARREGVDYREVTSLRLDYKNVLKIDNLWALENLTRLQLDNNIIEKIENIGFLKNLTWLDLSFNNITIIEGLDELIKLTDLSLFNNRITEIANMDNLTNLQVFSIGSNNITNLENLEYLTRFENLRVLNALGNPISKNPNYKHYALAYLKGLRYLDYRLVDDDSIKAAKEKYMDDLIALGEEEKIANAKKGASKKSQEQDVQYKRAHIGGIDNLFERMFEEDQDYKRLFPLARQQVLDQREDFSNKFEIIIREFTSIALKKCLEKDEEQKMFKNCLATAKKEADAGCIQQLNEFSHMKKTLSKRIQKSRVVSEMEGCLAKLREETKKLVEFFMSQEMQLVEGFEDVIKEFERNYTEICNTINENGQTAFARLRELENEFHERYSEILMSAFDRLSKGDLDEIEEEIREVIADKDLLVNSINSSHDFRIGKIDHQEDDLTTGVTKELEAVIAKTQNDEVQRNRDRVCEVVAFMEKCDNDTDTLEETSF